MRTHCPLFCFISLLLTASFHAKAQDDSLSALLTSGRYSEASQQAKRTPAGTVIAQVKSLASTNSAPAKWILADAYWRGGQPELSIQWGYSALVATQLDASVCRHNDLVAPWMQQAYEPIFREARRQPHLQTRAIQGALDYYAKNPALPVDKSWACRLGAQLAGDKSKSAERVPSDSTSERRRKQELEALIKKSGLNISIN